MPARTLSTDVPMPTVKNIEDARRNFLVGEPRYLFYRVATELIALARKNITNVSVAEALAVLLQTWNVSFYRFRGGFNEQDLVEIKKLLSDHGVIIEEYRQRSIASFSTVEEEALRSLFTCFETVLGPVGAAKALHLLAPLFFPIWDRAIAKVYRMNLNRGASHEYIRFMQLCKEQCRVLKEQGAPWPDLLKAIDEYNYCTFTLK
jgi:hypothetical protein